MFKAGIHRRFIQNIHVDWQVPATTEFMQNLFGSCSPIGEGHTGTVKCQPGYDCSSDAATAASDENDTTHGFLHSMTALAAAKGPAFDKLFLEGMIQHHGGALVMVRDLLKAPGAAQEAEIGDFASHVDADQRMEIIRMSAMLDTLKGIKR